VKMLRKLAASAPLLVVLGSVDARAQCGASTSECRSCHEVRAARPAMNEASPWHRDHAFGDFCALCHGGDPAAKDEAHAHASLVAPLADPNATCGTCHGAETSARVAKYGTMATAADAPAPPISAPREAPTARRVAWANVVLTSVIALFGSSGALYVATNERRLRAQRKELP